MNGINIELTPTQYDYLYEVIMMAYELDVPDQKGWDMQTYDNMVDNVCNGKSTILSNDVKGIQDSLETVTHRVDIRYCLSYIINVNQTPQKNVF